MNIWGVFAIVALTFFLCDKNKRDYLDLRRILNLISRTEFSHVPDNYLVLHTIFEAELYC